MRIAVTGAPGVGKTTLCGAAAAAGWTVASLLDLADARGLAGPVDPEDDARPIDVDALALALREEWGEPTEATAPRTPELIDGHMAHLLPTDAVCVIRCEPNVLAARLAERDYPAWKVEANVDWELLGSAWSDGVGSDEDQRPILEIDASGRDPAACFDALAAWVAAGTPSAAPDDAIDWIARQSE